MVYTRYFRASGRPEAICPDFWAKDSVSEKLLYEKQTKPSYVVRMPYLRA